MGVDHEFDATGGTEGDQSTAETTRRNVLRTGVGAAVGAGVLGAAGQPATAGKVEEVCNSDYGKIQVADKFKVMDNRWGMDGAHQCVWLNDDGSYGYDFDASGTGGGINYPEVFCGTRPWGDDTGVAEFPLRRSDVNELTMEVEADYNISGGEWDWAEEWWLMEGPPDPNNPPYTHEIMLLLDWGGGHDHGSVMDRNAWTDQYGNTVSLWTQYGSGGTSATFYIFRIEGGHDGGKIDMKEIVDYLSNNYGVRQDLTISGIELGNEYWGGASGEVTYNTFNVSVNGSTYTSGSGGGGGGGTATPEPDTTPPSTPGWLNASARGTNAVDLNWGASSDDDSGLAHYEIQVDGQQRKTVNAGSTSTTVWNLSPGSWYEFGVVAVDNAGNRSNAATASATTDSGATPTPTDTDDSSGSEECTGTAPAWPDGTQPCDIDGDGIHEDLNQNGRLDTDDVVKYFENLDADAMANNASYYDVNNNGRVDFDDVVSLFSQL